MVNGNIGGGLAYRDCFRWLWAGSVGLDMVREPAGQTGVGLRAGLHVMSLSVRNDIDYYGPSLRLAVFPFTSRDGNDSSHPHNYHTNYWTFGNAGVELRLDYLRPELQEGELFRGDDTWMITLNAVAELNSLHK